MDDIRVSDDRLGELIGFYEYRAVEADYDDIYNALRELAAYRAQLAEVTAERDVLRENVIALAQESVGLARLEAEVQRCAEAEADGRLVVLPFAPGDTIYDVYKEVLSCEGTVACDSEFGQICVERIHRGRVEDAIPLKDIGKTVFLTREEAEEALRKEQQDA